MPPQQDGGLSLLCSARLMRVHKYKEQSMWLPHICTCATLNFEDIKGSVRQEYIKKIAWLCSILWGFFSAPFSSVRTTDKIPFIPIVLGWRKKSLKVGKYTNTKSNSKVAKEWRDKGQMVLTFPTGNTQLHWSIGYTLGRYLFFYTFIPLWNFMEVYNIW